MFRNFLEQEEALDLLAGWNWFELDVNCTWACGPETSLSLVLPDSSSDALDAYFGLVLPPEWDDRSCEVLVDGVVQGIARVRAGSLTLIVPLDDTLRTVEIVLRLLGKPLSSADARLLGMGVATVAVHDRAATAGRTTILQAGLMRVLEVRK